MARKSWLRVALLTLMLPILIPLRVFAFFTNNALSQKWGLNIVCAISTGFLTTRLLDLRAQFIQYYFSSCGAVVHQQALQRIKMHQDNGDHVIIISGCPEWILHGMAKSIGIHHATLIGSKVSFDRNGLLLQEHCHQQQKVTMAQKRGFDLSQSECGYSDSVTDLPVLRLCKCVVAINLNVMERWYLSLFRLENVSHEIWN